MKATISSPAARIAGAYALFASLWIVTTGYLATRATDAPLAAFWVEMGKGLTFVLVTGVLLLLFLRREFARRERADQALRDSESRLRLLTENVTDVIWTMDLDLRFTSVTPSIMQLLGYSVEESMHNTLRDILSPASLETAAQVIAAEMTPASLQNKEPFWSRVVELEHVRKDGRRIWAEVRVGFMRDPAGTPVGIWGSTRDITERKRAEIALRENEERFRELFEHSPIGMYRTTPEGRILLANRALIEMLGYSSLEQLAQRSVEPDGIQLASQRQRRQAVLEREARVRDWEAVWRKADGTTIQARENAQVVRSAGGQVLYYEGTVEDITAHKQAEEALRASTARLLLATEASNIGFWDWDLRTNAVYYSPECKRQLGYEEDEIQDSFEEWDQRLHPEDHSRVLEFTKRYFANPWPHYETEYRLRHKDGSYRWVLARAALMCDAERKPERMVGIHLDITERKQAERELFESRQMLQLVLDTIPQRVFWKDHNLVYLGCNQPFALDAGLQEPREIVGKNDFQVAWAATAVRYRADDQQVMATDSAKINYEEPLSRPRGDLLWLRTTKVPLHDSEGKVIGILGTYEDITERKRVEERLQTSEALYHSLVENLPQNVFRKDLAGRFTFANQRFCQTIGKPLEAILGRTDLDFFPAELAEKYRADDRHLIETGEMFETVEKHHPPGGPVFHVHVVKTPLRDNHGQIIGIQGIFWDITERRQAEDALRESERRLSTLFQNLPGMAYRCANDRDRTMAFVSGGCRKLTGHAPEDLLENHGVAYGQLIYSEDQEQVWRETQTALEQGRPFELEYRIVARDGRLRWVWEKGQGVTAEGGQLTALEGFISDITEHKHAEDKVHEQAALLNIAHDAVGVCDLTDKVLFWNQGAERMYGWTATEALGRTVSDFLYRDLRQFEVAKATLLAQDEWSGELRQATKQGEDLVAASRWTLLRDAKGNPKSILVISTDITEKKRLEAQFLRAQRMESIGTLASGIAHDLNNILAPIIMAADVLQQNARDKSEREMLATIDQAARRGADIVKQVLTFARGIGGQRVLLQPRHLIKEVVKIAEETFPRDISVRSAVARDLWTVTGDATQLHQVLLNLAVNARDAMPNGGTLWMTAENIILDETQTTQTPDAKPGPYVVLQVQDTGTGIPGEILEKIFDPFFTTKPQGKGTGLGLSTVMGIVKSHGGLVQVWSEPGKGALFKVYLPATDATTLRPAEAGAAPLPRGRNELILVVDDEAAVRQVTLNTLRRQGYEVLMASHGKEALALFTRHRDRVQLVLTDIMMPVMDGYALAKELRKLAPEIRIIGSSGLIQDDDTAMITAKEFASFLNKPYTAEELLAAIASVLKPGNTDAP